METTSVNRRSILKISAQTLLIAQAVGALVARAQSTPSSQAVPFDNAAPWIDPVSSDQMLTKFKLYPQPSRAPFSPPGKFHVPPPQGSYQLYLPPSYDAAPGKPFQVLYWLHDEGGSSRDCAPFVERLHAAITAGTMHPIIVVSPQGLPGGWWLDSMDGARPVEQVITNDLINHIDQTYRTMPNRIGREIEGFGMGGYGALHLGFKRPDLFGKISAIAPSIARRMPVEHTSQTFLGDQEYYLACHPDNLALLNCVPLRKQKIRLALGSQDVHALAPMKDLGSRLTALGIGYDFASIAGVGHDYAAVIDGMSASYFMYWNH